ncbi:MAG: MATE family efflux transporter [Acidobacteriota bacterium]|nr:MAG: MATE family efflux transporter [Acidobacteriota bacterium]
MSLKRSSVRQFWNDLRESLAGTERDFTTENLTRAVTLLAIPMVLELVMQSIFGVIDVFFVARLGSQAVAAVGITESLLTIIFSIAGGLSMGITAVIARRIGEKNRDAAAVAAVQAIFVGLLVSAPITLVGLLYSRDLLVLMGASPSVADIGSGYNTIMIGGNLTIMLLFLINAIFRGAGDAVIAMRVLWIANLLNIALDPLLIFGLGPFPELGVSGAAVATNIARGLGVSYQVFLLFRGRRRIELTFGHLRLNGPVILNLCRVSLGGILQFLVATASWLGLVRIVALFGSSALAGYTIALRVVIFAILPSWGMSNAAATLVGQNLGAGKPDRAERSVWVTAFASMAFMVLITIAFTGLARPISLLFTQEAAVIPFAVDCLRYISYGYVFYACGMVVVQAFNGAGDTYTPTVINLFCYWLIQIPLAYWLALKMGMGAQGVFLAIAISESLLAVVAVLVFRRGRWKERDV